MNPIRISAATALLALVAPAPAVAQTAVPVPQFKSIELNGGGKVRLRYGPKQSVTLIKGSTQFTRIAVGDGRGRTRRGATSNSRDTLVIDACNQRCPHRYELEVEVVTPDLSAVAVNGGGAITTAGAFPWTRLLAVAVHGGGSIDVRSAPASSVAAAVHGGGLILAQPQASLAAAINGGGLIRYWGNPSVTSTVNGGGIVTRGGTR